MKPPLLCSCGVGYWPKQAWLHVKCATNTASNSATNTEEVATNNGQGIQKEVGLGSVEETSPGGVMELVPSSEGAGRMDRSANRRTREAFNAYQREYMRKRREIARSG